MAFRRDIGFFFFYSYVTIGTREKKCNRIQYHEYDVCLYIVALVIKCLTKRYHFKNAHTVTFYRPNSAFTSN